MPYDRFSLWLEAALAQKFRDWCRQHKVSLTQGFAQAVQLLINQTQEQKEEQQDAQR